MNKVERDARLDELKNMVASFLQSAMQDTAPLRLAELQKSTRSRTRAVERCIDRSYDSVAMFLEDEAKANDGDVSEYSVRPIVPTGDLLAGDRARPSNNMYRTRICA